MTDHLIKSVTTKADLQQLPTPHLYAKNAQQMADSQQQMTQFFQAKLTAANEELEICERNLKLAQQGSYNMSSFTRQIKTAKKRTEFFEKALAALHEGYSIVPNMPLEIFMIRTTAKVKGKVTLRESSSRTTAIQNIEQNHSNAPPIHEGENVSPIPEVETCGWPYKRNDGDRYEVMDWYASGFNEVIDFPMAVAHPVLIDSITKASKKMIFDDMGIVQEPKGDPLIIGRIRYPNQPNRSWSRHLAFLIGWYVDLRTL